MKKNHNSSAPSSSSSTERRLRVSGAADNFHRVGSRSNTTSRSRSSNVPPATAAAAASTDDEGDDSSRNTTNSSNKDMNYGIRTPPISGNAPNLQNIDRDVGGLPQITSSGFHMPPEVLGQVEDTLSKSTQNNNSSATASVNTPKKTIALANLNKLSRRRSFLAVKAIKSAAAAAAAAKRIASSSSCSEVNEEENNIALDSSMFTTVIYRGMEVVFSYVISHRAIAGVCSRTNFLFQKLNLASKAPVVSITSNSSSGMIIVAHEDGIIQTYIPVQTDPSNFEEKQTQKPKSVFGRFRWIDCITINAAEVFYHHSGEETVKFCDRRYSKAGDLIDISSSYDYKILVAHRQQLAVFEAFPPIPKVDDDTDRNNNEIYSFIKTNNAATLLWTTMLSSKVVNAKISGDGQAVVAVIDQPDDDDNFGAMTFLHDKDDGSSSLGASVASTGIVFKSGPYLKHTTPVTRMSFRGLGHVTPSANPEEMDGNDLLLTYCEEDSSARIFNQNSWRQLMLWATPPNTRADWIRGSSAFSLGDLESQTKSTSSRALRAGKSRPNSISSDLSGATGSISSGLQPAGTFRSSGTGSPTSDAGAWIAEITFREAYPALRLSRLSYMKRGNDDSQPAHFESIAAILPAGSIIAESVLNADDMGLSIQGVWPAWNPWLSEPSGNESDNGFSGSAMKFLGLSSVPPPSKSQGTFGEYYSGGTHSPPTELRLVASHPKNGHLVLMDFPLWGEDEFGAMELGSPIRNVLALSAVCSLREERKKPTLIVASMDYESSRLCAEIESEGRSISLFWRKEGCMSTYSPQWGEENTVFLRKNNEIVIPDSPDLLFDMSLVPVPLALPPLKLPKGTTSANEDTVIAIKWWPDDSFGGPPLLVAVTKSKTILVYEIPPPLFALEPTMPNFDSANPQSSIASGTELYDTAIAEDGSDDEEATMTGQNYDVLVTPHPDFGLGLRLESPMDGLPAIAGSFKKNPLNDGILPAEKTGMIKLGDELLSVNGVNLENTTFDDIIATVRHVGTELGPGEPLKMTFRPVPFDRSRKNSAVVQESFSARSSDRSNASQNNEKSSDINSQRGGSQDTASLAAMLFSNSAEAQQEFGRVIAVIRKAVPSVDGDDFADRFIILPWNNETTTSSQRRIRAAALMLHASGSKIQVRRVELPTRTGLDKAKKFDLGVIDMLQTRNGIGNNDRYVIRTIACVESIGERWCFVVSDSLGGLRLLYLNFSNKKSSNTGDGSAFEMSHQQYHIIDVGNDFRDFRLHSSCPSILAAIQKSENPRCSIKVWHARPDPSPRDLRGNGTINDDYFNRDYYESTIVVDPSESDSELVDFCFLKTGYLEAFPTIVAFLTSEAIVYQRRGGSKKWTPIIRLPYPAISTSSRQSNFNQCVGRISGDRPMDTYPHLMRLIRATLSSYDEKHYLLSDWHPETMFTLLCMEEKGAKLALTGDIKRVLLWLSDKIDGSPEDNLSSNVPLLVAPLALWGSEVVDASIDTNNDGKESAASLMASMTIGGSRTSDVVDKDKRRLKRLQDVLDKHIPRNGINEEDPVNIPEILSTMHANELRVLQAILSVAMEPPKYGKLDPQGQLTLTIYAIHREYKNIENDEEKSTSKSSMSMQSFHHAKRQMKLEADRPKLHPQNASAGCLAALSSDYQQLLVDTIRQPGEKLDWLTVRNLRIPFWLRSDEKLRQLSEEIGQNLYRKSKDILKSAIFFIIARKMRTLKNLAAADMSMSGRKFHKFLINYDFSSERGRVAAEKNAFSLLRKNQYDSAAAFFLLADPPILKSAVETIATKMEDIDLAFLVARLLGNSLSSSGQSAGLGFGGTLGGGGGFAGSGPPILEVTKDKETFKDWKPRLGPVAKSLILDRGLPSAHNDTCLSAVQLIWLGRFDEAFNWLSGLVDYNGKDLPYFVEDLTFPQLHRPSAMAKKSRDSTVFTMNSCINLVSGPFLLKMMKASERTRLASTFALCRSLVSAGIEVSALRSLMKNMDEAKFEKEGYQNTCITAIPRIEKQQNVPTSSIFDTFDVPQQRKAPQHTPPSDQLSSSIFDSFDAPPAAKPKPASTPMPNSGDMSSSIFDSFDAPPPKPKIAARPASTPNSGDMTSSIFDSFDAPPPKPKIAAKPASTANSGDMTSSIFDSFDAPPPKPRIAASAGNGMVSSIFDSFDPPRPMKLNSTSSGAMESSIFDTFDASPSSKGIATPNADKSTETNNRSQKFVEGSDEVLPETKELRSPPSLWIEWQKDLICDAAARRLIRELSTLCAPYYCDEFDKGDFCEQPLMTSDASQVLHFHCDGEVLIKDVREVIGNISKLTALECKVVVERAIQLLYTPYQFYRTLYVVLLLAAIKQVELAEDVLRMAAQSLVERCYSNAFSNSHVANGRRCAAHLSTLSSKKFAAHMSWQLELCLWIHRGGALPLSGLALNEAICSVRIGYFVASWNRDFKVQELMMKQPPDCLIDEGAGRQLWSSLKIISGGAGREKNVIGTGSGGWEFLVDCRRARATELLRERPTGSFIIRPHPQDHGVFTISFKTNLVPSQDSRGVKPNASVESSNNTEERPKPPPVPQPPSESRPIKRDDVVQHAIVRLSDSGFRCGSFGPFGTLMDLLEAVSSSLPFNLRFDLPPTEGIIKEEGSKPSPNSTFLRKLGMLQADPANNTNDSQFVNEWNEEYIEDHKESNEDKREIFGLFFELVLLHGLRKQLSAVAAAEYDSAEWLDDATDDVDSIGSISDVSVDIGVEQEYAIASRIMRPLLIWCRMMEIEVSSFLAPSSNYTTSIESPQSISLEESETAIEISTSEKSNTLDGGDLIIRRMIQPDSGVEFRTLRLGDGGENAMVVLFSKKEAVAWFLNNGVETDEEDAVDRLNFMEKSRIIEAVDLRLLAPKAYKKKKKKSEDDENAPIEGEASIDSGIRYRLVDPWEVEPLENREAETKGASLGREHLLAFSLTRATSSCEDILKSLGGLHLLELWTTLKGGISLTKSIATVQAPWERSAGGDLLLCDGVNAEPSVYDNSIREHLYRNLIFNRLQLPQRYVALIQVELLDLKNLTSPGGSLTLTVYSLLRLKRARSGAPLTSKARTLDSVSTDPIKLSKTSGPNAPASWGSLVRFRYPLPENTDIEGKCYDSDCESLFKGPPSVLQISVYEKKFMSDSYLGGADIKLNGLGSGGQLEEWVPLKTETNGINWFARIRLTLRFELMCLAPKNEPGTSLEKLAPSVGRNRIQKLCSVGGAQFDLKQSVSTPDILSYFESYFETD